MLAPSAALRKRFRHRRRHYRALERWAREIRIDVGADAWYDDWHTHWDWRGDGNRGPRDRRRHLAVGFAAFRAVLGQARESGRPMQVFLSLDARDSGFDAVHAHTPNPNRDNYPLPFDWVEWDVPVPGILREFLTEPEWQLGRARDVPTLYLVRPRPTATADEPSPVPRPRARIRCAPSSP